MKQLPLELRYGTPKHDRILQEVRSRYAMSRNEMAKRHTQWKESEELFKAYLPVTTEDARRKAEFAAGKPTYQTIVIPYSYAIVMAAHTYWTSVFLGRSPVMQFMGRHGETEQQIQAVEAVMDYQLSVGEMLAPLYVWFLDVAKYGFGVLGLYWADEVETVSRLVERPRAIGGFEIPGTSHAVKETINIEGYSGNKLFNVRPHDFFPDPRVSIANFQTGEFCGRSTTVGWNEILRRKATGEYFNVDNLRELRSTGALDRIELTNVEELPQSDLLLESTQRSKDRAFSNLVEMCIELPPGEWELGDGQRPEKWAFTMAENSVIVGASPLGCCHNRFPFGLITYEYDRYTTAPRGMLEVIQPLNKVMTWLVNSHFYNVRKVQNDQLVVDPSRFVMGDLEDGGPGRIIRLSPMAYGSDVRQGIMQLPVTDITRGHVADMQVIADIIQRVTGVNDNILGMLNVGGRKTATEVRSATSFGINRLKTSAEYFSALGFSPLVAMMVKNTQQFYDAPKVFRIAGSLANKTKFVDVDPSTIVGAYDFVPVDGTLPVDRYAQATLWREILLGLGKFPQLASQFDLAGIFVWMAQLGGLKNIEQFRLQPMPDAQVAGMERAGDLVPARYEGGEGGARGVIASDTGVRLPVGTAGLETVAGVQ